MKKLIATTICILLLSGMTAQISIIGTATPANDWVTDIFMTQDPGNSSLWSITVNLSNNHLKFRENASWDVNWGNTSFPSGYGILDGPNIPVNTSGNYFITFNTETLIYNFTLLSAVSTGISHQAVIRNAAGELISGVPVGIQVSIIQGAPDGTTVYVENHTLMSNANGLITFIIANGNATYGSFVEIDWQNGPYFIKTEADPSGGNTYSIQGTSQMLSVPYAMHANSSNDSYWEKTDDDIHYQQGNVGIGTSNPLSLLHLDSDNRAFIISGNGTTANTSFMGLGFQYSAFSGEGAIMSSFPSGYGRLTFYTTQTGVMSERMRIELNGNVGIGTTNPTQQLDVNGNIRLRGGNRSLGTWSDNHLFLTTNDAIRMAILSGGNVGINTVSPGQLLDVNGNIQLSGSSRSLGTWSNHNLHLVTNTSARLTILSNGNIGIGHNNPSNNLRVSGSYGTNLAFFHNVRDAGSSGEQSSVYGFLSSGQGGAGYGHGNSRAALKGYTFFGYAYTFGVAGYRFDDNFNRGGGVFGGSTHDAMAWGCLGYRNSAGSHYGGYFNSSHVGPGKDYFEPMINIGLAAWGDLMGAGIHGKVYGMFVEGENYAIYSNGLTYKNNLDVHLQENGTNTLSALYTNVSNQVTVQTSGIATINNGKATIMFDPVFAASVSDKEPVIVTVTPVGNSNGLYLAEVNAKGFSVVENNDGKSNVTLNYIAIGRRAGYENPKLAPEVIDAEYTSKIARGLHNDANTETDGEGLYYENRKLVVGKHPSTTETKPKPAEPDFTQHQNQTE